MIKNPAPVCPRDPVISPLGSAILPPTQHGEGEVKVSPHISETFSFSVTVISLFSLPTYHSNQGKWLEINSNLDTKYKSVYS